jgi:hypothetical protein
MSDQEFNRHDPSLAESVISSLCQNATERHHLLAQLLSSCSIAERISPLSRAVTLFQDSSGFRLNVGQVEVFTFKSGWVRLLLHGAVPPLPTGEVIPTFYASAPQPQSALQCSTKVFAEVSALVQEAHSAFVRAAAVTSSGKPRSTSFARSHSPGLLVYAQQFAGEQVGA